MRPAPTLAEYGGQRRGAGRCGGKHLSGLRASPCRTPRISIVTVVHNGAATLGRTVHSVLSQDYPAVEYLIVDGGSDDGTLEIIRQFEERIDYWLSEPDAGISDAFNKGIALSTGYVIGLLNADDWYEPGETLSAVARVFEETDADIVYGKLRYWAGTERSYLVQSDANLLSSGMTVGHPTVFVRRSCYERLGLFRLDFAQAMDYEWLLRAKMSGARFRYLDRCIANMHSGGIGDRRWRKSVLEVARARAMHLPNARSRLHRVAYVAWTITKGTLRRTLEAVGLGIVRRWYHRYLSPVRVSRIR